MKNKKIIIVTGTGGPLGTGHIQRMLNLASYMKNKGDFEIKIIPLSGDYLFPDEFTSMVSKSFPLKADLIIRDMRNSSEEEILSLSKIAPVLAVDDSGTGRNHAAHSINLLPQPSSEPAGPHIDNEKFLYGYNFTRGIESISINENNKRDIDIAIYAGFNPPEALLPLIEKSIPDNSRAIIFSSGSPVVLTGEPLPEKSTYAEILTRTRIVMTHFGITMFEAHICGCMIAALNPTPYHSQLTSSVMNKIKIIHSIEYNTFAPLIMNDALTLNLKKNSDTGISKDDIIKRINSGRENFTQYIYKILM